LWTCQSPWFNAVIGCMAFTSQFPIQNISERCWRPIVRAIGWLTPWYKLNVAQKKGPIEIMTGDV
jgi:hypothetical protein